MKRLTQGFRDRKALVKDYINQNTKGSSRSGTPEPSSSVLPNASCTENTESVSPIPAVSNNSTLAPTVAPQVTVTPALSTSLYPTPNITLVPTGQPSSKSGIASIPWTALKALVGVLESASGAFDPLKSAIKAISECVETYETVSRNREEYTALKTDLEARFQDLSAYFCNPTPPSMTLSIENLANGIIQEIGIIRQKVDRTTIEQYARATKDADDIMNRYRQIDRLLERLVQNANMNIWKIVDEQATERRLDKLCPSSAAWYSSAESSGRRNECTPQTRTDVLSDMRKWTCEGEEKIYWLNGMAGTGKTTIAYSLSDELHKNRKLAASFFCSQQIPSCRDVNLIFPTLSYQLARFSHPFKYALSSILERHPDVHTRQLSEQFGALIMGPLQEVQKTIPLNLVVVVDGLDECEKQDGVEIILGILLSKTPGLPIKFFVSSRPEPRIVSRMEDQKDERTPFQLRLHEIERTIVRNDIGTYLRVELQDMHLPSTDLQKLANQCDALFIYAATAVRYIKAGGPIRQPERLNRVLDAPTLSAWDKKHMIDSLYTEIIGAAFNNEDLDDKEEHEMRMVLHTAVCAQEPLTPAMMACLLEIPSEDLVRAVLAPLSSVLSVSEITGAVSTLHASFPDYLFDESRSKQFYCDMQEHNARLTFACFRLIKVPEPPFNICRLESSFVFDEDVPDIEERTKKHISAELFYACKHWCSHLELAKKSKGLVSSLQEFLAVRLLLWMEVMNLKRCIHIGALAMSKVQPWLKNECMQNVRELIADASRFTTVFSSNSISRSTPHIYVSGLPLWPAQLPVSQCYMRRATSPRKSIGTATVQKIQALLVTWTTAQSECSVAYSPNGTRIVSGRADGTIGFWGAHNSQMVGKLIKGHAYSVNSVSYSPDGTRIVSGSGDSTIRIWDAETGLAVGEPLEGHTEWVSSVSYSPDGTRIVSGSGDNTIRIWDAETGQAIGEPLEGHTDSVSSVSYSPDGTRIVSGSWDKALRIWDAGTSQIIGESLEGHTDWVTSVSHSPDGTRIVSSSADNTIRIWDAKSGQAVGEPLEGHTDLVESVSYSPDGIRIVSGSRDKSVRIWNAETGQTIGEPLEDHTDWVESVSYSPDGTRIVSGSHDNTIRIWDAETSQIAGKPLEGHTDTINSVSYSPDGTHIVSGSEDRSIKIWDAETGQAVREPLEGHTHSVRSVSYSPDGTRIVSGSADNTVRIWDAETGQTIGMPLEGHTDWVNSVSYSRDGTRIVSAGDNTIRIWDAETGQTIGKPLEGHTDWVRYASYSPDGTRIVSCSDDRTVRIWNTETGQTLGEPLKGHTNWIFSASYSPDGTRIVSGCDDCTIRIWSAETGQIIVEPLEGHTHWVTSVSYSPDGTRIVSCSADKTIRIWDAETGQVLGEPLEGHADRVNSVSYSPDGTHIVSGSADNVIRVWDVQGGQTTENDREGEFNNDRHQTYHSNQFWTVGVDGWVISSRSEPLMWIPSALRRGLLRPQNTAVISRLGTLRLDFTDADIGESWSHCYQSAV